MKVMVVFGGRSGEHEVSLDSATAVMEALERSGRYEIIPAGITREGRWILGDDPMSRLRNGDTFGEMLPPGDLLGAEVVFPVLHGPYGEDGAIQGMLQMAGVPYVGSGVLASAVSMDKISMKKIFDYHSLPQTDWLGFTSREWEDGSESLIRQIENYLRYPCFVKPSNLGSSVGIHRANSHDELEAAVEEAITHDRRIIVERGVDAREIEISLLGNEEPEVSVPGEILLTSEGYYDYEAKYGDGGMRLQAPADLPYGISSDLQRIARTAYTAVDAAGMARLDFFLERDSGRLLLNEINTIPGFTSTSVYAKLWQESGLPYEELLDRLVGLALKRGSS